MISHPLQTTEGDGGRGDSGEAAAQVLCDYVLVMVGNKKPHHQICSDLEVHAPGPMAFLSCSAPNPRRKRSPVVASQRLGRDFSLFFAGTGSGFLTAVCLVQTFLGKAETHEFVDWLWEMLQQIEDKTFSLGIPSASSASPGAPLVSSRPMHAARLSSLPRVAHTCPRALFR